MIKATFCPLKKLDPDYMDSMNTEIHIILLIRQLENN